MPTNLPGFSLFAPFLMTSLQLQAALGQFIKETDRDIRIAFTELMGTQRGGVGSAMNLIAHLNGSEGGLVYYEGLTHPRPLGVQLTMYEVMHLQVWGDLITPAPKLSRETIIIHSSRTLRGTVPDMMASDFADAFCTWLTSKIPRA